jgi:hypothetical protein
VIGESTVVTVAPVAGLAIVHEVMDGIALERRDAVEWAGTAAASRPIVIRHELGDARPHGMRAVLDVPPWCTFHVDVGGEPAAHFHAIFGEVDRLLVCEEPGATYTVRYGAAPREPVVALQSELATYSFALSARGVGLIAHACAFATAAGSGVLCPGVSGTGKTTLARLLCEQPSRVAVLTDDRAIVTLDGNALTVWGSPWPGAARIAGAGAAPLETVVFIRHGAAVGIKRVAPRDAFRRMLNTMSMPLWEPARCGRALEILDAVVSRATLLEASYPPTASAARWLVAQLGALGSLGAS